MTQDNAHIALAILDSIAPHTLNAIVCDLTTAGNLPMLRAVRELKGTDCFSKPKGLTAYRFEDPFNAAVKIRNVEAVRELLSYDLLPELKLSSSTKAGEGEHSVPALDMAFDSILKAKSDEEKQCALAVALELYHAVKGKMPPLCSVSLRYVPSAYSSSSSSDSAGVWPAKALGERLYAIHGESAPPKKVKFESFLDHCISNKIEPLKEAVLAYVESFPTECFSSRSAELLVATHDMKNFARLMSYQGEVHADLMDQILKLPQQVQEQALEVVAELEIDAGVIDKLGDFAATITPVAVDFLLSKCSIDMRAGQVSALLVKATRQDNVALMEKLITIGNTILDWSVDDAGSETVRYIHRGSVVQVERPIHECRSGDAVRLLVEHGADIEVLDADGKTPLQAMVSSGRVDKSNGDNKGPGLLAALLEAGADMTARYKGRTLTQLAAPRSEEVKAILRAGRTTVLVDATLGDAALSGQSRRGGLEPM